jgi:formyl-CoA transferase
VGAVIGFDQYCERVEGEQRRPDHCGIYIADVLSGTYAFGAIMTALYHRQLTGRGQMIDVSMRRDT